MHRKQNPKNRHLLLFTENMGKMQKIRKNYPEKLSEPISDYSPSLYGPAMYNVASHLGQRSKGRSGGEHGLFNKWFQNSWTSHAEKRKESRDTPDGRHGN